MIVAVAACSKQPAPPVEPEAWTCDALPFAATTPLAEASGAAWLPDGLIVVSDSGNDGAYAILDPETGDTREQGKLPLGAASDDIEGLAARGDKLYGLTSGGWMRVWRRDGTGFALVDGPYPIGTGDMVCKADKGNCGYNYEGLCLAPLGGDGCTGFAASKTDGHLYCLTVGEHGLVVDPARSIAVARPKHLGDCTFGDDGTLWIGGNIFSGNAIWRVDGWRDPAHAKVVAIGNFGIGNAEVIAVRGDVLYRMSDTNSAPSLMAKFRCRPAARR